MRVQPLALLATFLIFSGCSSSAQTTSSADTSLAGPLWTLAAFGDGTAPLSENLPTAQFDADGSVSGFAGCNRYFGSYENDGGQISLSPLGATKRLCAPPVNAQERQFMDALQSATHWERSDDALTLADASGGAVLRLAASGEATTIRTLDEESETLTGEVAYRERIALPPDAVITVQLQDVSLADAPARTLATHTIRPNGRQVPIPYALSYSPSSIDGAHAYIVRAEVRDARGDLLWVSDTAHPVLTRGAPTADVRIQLVQVAAPTGTTPEAAPPLVGTSWRLQTLVTPDGEMLTPEERGTYAITFTDDGLVQGRMACNQFGAAYEALGGAISLGSIAVTAAICFRRTIETPYTAALRGAQVYATDGDRLQIQGAGGTLTFGPDTGESPVDSNAPAPSTLAAEAMPFQCTNESGRPFQFTLREGDNEARVALPALLGGQILSLSQVPAASGTKYQAEGVTVWLKGAEVLLEVDGETYTNCEAE